MALRPDENFVKDCLVKFLGGPKNVEAWEGEDPPDVYLRIGGDTIAVEITRLSPPITQRLYAVNLCNELDQRLRDQIGIDRKILLTFDVPVQNPRHYRRELYSRLQEFVRQPVTIGERRQLNVAGEKIDINILHGGDPSGKKIGCIIGSKNSSPDIFSNAKTILFGRISTKQRVYKGLGFDGAKWLALLNDYWLAEPATYAQAMEEFPLRHDFEKMFVVLYTGSVQQIY